jgi:hypothetical protein
VFIYLYPHFSPGRPGAGSSKSMESPLGWCESNFRTAKSNLDALSTADLGPKRHFSVGECALWERLTGPQFVAQVAAVVGLVEAPVKHCKSTAVVRRSWSSSMATGRAIRSKVSRGALRRQTPQAHFKGHQGGGGRGGSDSRRSHSRGRPRGDEASGC